MRRAKWPWHRPRRAPRRRPRPRLRRRPPRRARARATGPAGAAPACSCRSPAGRPSIESGRPRPRRSARFASAWPRTSASDEDSAAAAAGREPAATPASSVTDVVRAPRTAPGSRVVRRAQARGPRAATIAAALARGTTAARAPPRRRASPWRAMPATAAHAPPPVAGAGQLAAGLETLERRGTIRSAPPGRTRAGCRARSASRTAAFLRQVGRREIHGDAPAGHSKPALATARTRSRLSLHLRWRQTDDREHRQMDHCRDGPRPAPAAAPDLRATGDAGRRPSPRLSHYGGFDSSSASAALELLELRRRCARAPVCASNSSRATSRGGRVGTQHRAELVSKVLLHGAERGRQALEQAARDLLDAGLVEVLAEGHRKPGRYPDRPILRSPCFRPLLLPFHGASAAGRARLVLVCVRRDTAREITHQVVRPLARKLQKAQGRRCPEAYRRACRAGTGRDFGRASDAKQRDTAEPGPESMKLITAIIRPYKLDRPRPGDRLLVGMTVTNYRSRIAATPRPPRRRIPGRFRAEDAGRDRRRRFDRRLWSGHRQRRAHRESRGRQDLRIRNRTAAASARARPASRPPEPRRHRITKRWPPMKDKVVRGRRATAAEASALRALAADAPGAQQGQQRVDAHLHAAGAA